MAKNVVDILKDQLQEYGDPDTVEQMANEVVVRLQIEAGLRGVRQSRSGIVGILSNKTLAKIEPARAYNDMYTVKVVK